MMLDLPSDAHVIASISGGKDSAAMALHLREHGIDFEPVFLDVGWEHPATLDYVNGPLTDLLGPITRVRAEVELKPELEPIAQRFEEQLGHYSGFIRLVIKKGMFPSRRRRFCTQVLKVHAMAGHIKGLDSDMVYNAVGIRGAESAARAKRPSLEYADLYDGWIWLPIHSWTFQDVVDIHARHDLVPNPLYLRGAERVGCWPCIHARKSEIRWMADVDPERVQLIRELEKVVGDLAEVRTAAKGEHGNRPAFYQASLRRAEDGKRPCVPIDTMIEWSRTAHGGRQFELLFPGAEQDKGCMRWGLCDAGVTP